MSARISSIRQRRSTGESFPVFNEADEVSTRACHPRLQVTNLRTGRAYTQMVFRDARPTVMAPYNGDMFDFPAVEARAKIHGIDMHRERRSKRDKKEAV
jgi:DNA polymerase elongation subunit (family B)